MWQVFVDRFAKLAEKGAALISSVFSRECNTPPEQNAAFTMAVIALGAKMAKADGVVVGVEVEAFDHVFSHAREDARRVHALFDLAQRDVAGFESYANQIAGLLADRPHILTMVVESLFHIATADRALHPAEDAFLRRVAEIFGMSASTYRHVRAQFVRDPGSPYDVLGLSPQVSDGELRARYRQLVRENHPDVLAGQGVSPDLVVVADRKLAAINAAYAEIAAERGLTRAETSART